LSIAACHQEAELGMDDAEFLAAFESCELPRDDWTHTAHVRMAWLYLRRGPLDEMMSVVCQGIRRYNARQRRELAYHETITRAFLVLIDLRMR
jgi:hypothetical protein